MRSMEFSGRSVDEAIFNGLREMGVTIDEVEIETIKNESKGLFGLGAKMAVVRMTEREVPLVVEMEQAHQERPPMQRPQRSDRAPRGNGDRGARSGDRRSDYRGSGRSERTDRDDRRQQPSVPEVQYDYSEELARETPAAQFLTELLEKMNIPCRVLAANTESGLRLCIDADTMGLLIGRRGETLDALQYIVSLYANKNRKQEGYVRVTLDTEGYRSRREETLKRLARKTAAQVRASGRSVAMEPMNPYERRVLHSALQGFSGVSTHSEGEEPNRRVVITPEEQA